MDVSFENKGSAVDMRQKNIQKSFVKGLYWPLFLTGWEGVLIFDKSLLEEEKMAEKKSGAAAKKVTAGAKKVNTAKRKVKKGDAYSCEVCGLVVTVDEVCGCVDTCDIICCDTQMKPKK